jgi:hypothetical protein
VRCAEKGEVVVDGEGSAAATSWMLLGCFLSGVIDFRLEQVMIPRCLLGLEVVVRAACAMTTTSMLRLRCMLSFEYIVNRAHESIQQTEQRNPTVR